MNITINDLLNQVKTYNSEEIEIIKKAYWFIRKKLWYVNLYVDDL